MFQSLFSNFIFIITLNLEKYSEITLVAQTVKNLPVMQETPGSIPGLGRSPGEGNGNPLQYSCLENPRDGGAVGYSPWDRKESDTTEQLHFQCDIWV